MFSTTTDTINPRVYIIVATLMMLLTLGLTEAFKDNVIVQEDLFDNHGCDITTKLGFS